MNATLNELLQNTRLLWFLAAGLAVAVVPWLFRAPLTRKLEARRVRRAISSLGAATAHDLLIADGLDSHVYVEHLVLAEDKLVVVSVKRYPGAIFGAANMNEWAQVLREGSYKFANPLNEMQDMVAAAKSQAGGVAVDGLVVFDRYSSFPKGKPDGVVHINDIDTKQTPPALTDIDPALVRAWESLSGQKINRPAQ